MSWASRKLHCGQFCETVQIVSDCKDRQRLSRKLKTVKTISDFKPGITFQHNLNKKVRDGVRNVSDAARKVSDGVRKVSFVVRKVCDGARKVSDGARKVS